MKSLALALVLSTSTVAYAQHSVSIDDGSATLRMGAIGALAIVISCLSLITCIVLQIWSDNINKRIEKRKAGGGVGKIGPGGA